MTLASVPLAQNLVFWSRAQMIVVRCRRIRKSQISCFQLDRSENIMSKFRASRGPEPKVVLEESARRHRKGEYTMANGVVAEVRISGKHHFPTKARNASTTATHRSCPASVLTARPRRKLRSCPAPSIGNNDVATGIKFRADFISSSVPNGSREPCTNSARVRRSGK